MIDWSSSVVRKDSYEVTSCHLCSMDSRYENNTQILGFLGIILGLDPRH